MKRHSFCSMHALKNYGATRKLWDTPIFESESFAALPTVGALVEGWLLVVPKTAALSFSKLSTSLFAELDQFVGEVAAIIETNYGSVSLFEHGPSALRSNVGCGVDYAHLHLVPTRCDLVTGAQHLAPNIIWNRVKSFNDIRRFLQPEDDYWFVQHGYGSDQCYLGKCLYGQPPSQLFRRVIAKDLGCPSAYDWKTSAGEILIAATVEKLNQHVVLS